MAIYKVWGKMAFKLMSNYSRLQEVKKENKEKDKVRREKLAGLFFDLAKLSFAGLVVGGIVSMKPDVDMTLDIYRVIIGGVSTIIFIRIGNTILK
jgi:hypothetical protein